MRRCATILVLLGVLLSGCRSLRMVREEEERRSDSVTVRTEYIERIDTAYVTLTKEVQMIVTKDTTSVLENQYSVSRVEIDGDGMLHHCLESKGGRIPVPVTTVEIVRDSVIVKDNYIKVREPYPVEKELSRWQVARLHGFWLLLASTVLCLAWMARKPLVRFFLRIFGK